MVERVGVLMTAEEAVEGDGRVSITVVEGRGVLSVVSWWTLVEESIVTEASNCSSTEEDRTRLTAKDEDSMATTAVEDGDIVVMTTEL